MLGLGSVVSSSVMSGQEVWNLILFYFREEFAFYIFIAGLIISFVLSFAVGANDSANSWGTSVGAKTVSLGWAYFFGSVCEIVGCTLLSGDVIGKVVNGIINIDAYKSNVTKEDIANMTLANFTNYENNPDLFLEKEKLLAIGCFSVMLASGVWQLIASIFSWPVSGTHCIIFGLLGFTVTAMGADGVANVNELIQIIAGLFVSIILSVVLTAMLYGPLYKYCIRPGKPFKIGNRIVYGIIAGLAVGLPVAFIVNQTEKAYGIFPDNLSKTTILLISLGIGLGVATLTTILSIFVFLPLIKNMKGNLALDVNPSDWLKSKKRKEKERAEKAKQVEMQDTNSPAVIEITEESLDEMEVTKIFRPLQILSAINGSLVHGGNDVANCIGPFVVIFYVYKDGILPVGKVSAPWAISLLGGVGIAAGFIMFGHRVIKTMGTNISEMNSSRGFCVEWVASVIVLCATVIGLPMSTTHCKVGGVIGAGLVQGLVETNSPKMALKYVNFKILLGVLLSWVLTIPMSFGLSSVIYLILKSILM